MTAPFLLDEVSEESACPGGPFQIVALHAHPRRRLAPRVETERLTRRESKVHLTSRQTDWLGSARRLGSGTH